MKPRDIDDHHLLPKLTSVEICAGAGGQALGLEMAGFDHSLLVEIDAPACATLRLNRPSWNVQQADLRQISLLPYRGIDLLAGGVPCPPFSIAGKQLGSNDERDLFPEALRFVEESMPKAVMLENVRGLAGKNFQSYRNLILRRLESLGYVCDWKLVNASDFAVPQLRPRFILVALKEDFAPYFRWPAKSHIRNTVGSALGDLMKERGWTGAEDWISKSNNVAPTLVGGSKKHGGADLGPSRAKQKWAELGVDGKGIANDPPDASAPFDLMPRLTLRMAARIQGFPDDWEFSGKKTATYRQIGNAFPPPVAYAIGMAIRDALHQVKPTESEESMTQLSLLSSFAHQD